MNDHERIEAMFEAGRITREQADQLLAALAASDSAEQEADSLQQEPSAAAGVTDRLSENTGPGTGNSDPGPGRAGHQVPPGPDPAPPAPVPTSKRDSGPLDSDYKWLQIDTFAGNLEIKVVEGLTQPEADEGNVTITENGARIAPWDVAGDGTPRSFIDRIFDGLRSSDLEVRLPPGWAVEFDVKAGNIDINGAVKAIKGHLRAGDLSVEETGNAYVKVAAGEAEIGLRATSGSNRIQVSVGQADVRILSGSNVKVDASVNIGDISARTLTKNSRGLGAHAFGQVGGGTAGSGADLNVSVVTGDVSIRVPENV